MGKRYDPIGNFWAKVDRGSPQDCWTWLASLGTAGYGQFWNGKTRVGAHRFVYELLVGIIPDNMTIDHLCRNRNPNGNRRCKICHREQCKRNYYAKQNSNR